MDDTNGPGVHGVKNGPHAVAAMARSTDRSAGDAGPRGTTPTARGEAARDPSEPRELSLEEVLKSYEQPINEEQAWAVCYQCCGGARGGPRPPAGGVVRAEDPSSVLLQRDGTVSLRRRDGRIGRLTSLFARTQLGKSAFSSDIGPNIESVFSIRRNGVVSPNR